MGVLAEEARVVKKKRMDIRARWAAVVTVSKSYTAHAVGTSRYDGAERRKQMR